MAQHVYFPQLFADYSVSPEIEQAVAQLRVVDAQIDRNDRRIALQLQSNQYIRQKNIRELMQQLQTRYGLRQLQIDV